MEIKNVPWKERYDSFRAETAPTTERNRLLALLDRGFPGESKDFLMLPPEFDSAFLRFQQFDLDIRTVYCLEILKEIWANGVAGLTPEKAEEDLCLLIKTFPEGRRPLFD
jgi:hypothetical protein